jgi:cell wall-associated NlpC family hydrolase
MAYAPRSFVSVDEAAERARAVAAARTWVGTPFVDQGDKKGCGVDCAMLLVRVYCDLGIIDAFDPRPYAPQWLLHQDEELFLGWVSQFGPETDEIKPGNVIVYKFGRCFAHGAIIISDEHIIQAYQDRRKVVVSELKDISLTHYKTGKPRPRKIFDPWGERDGRQI